LINGRRKDTKVRGGAKVQKMAKENKNIIKANDMLTKEKNYLSEELHLIEQELCDEKIKNGLALIKIKDLKSKISDLKQTNGNYKQMELKLTKSKLSKLIKPVMHTVLVLRSRMTLVHKTSIGKKHIKDELRVLKTQEKEWKKNIETVNNDLDHAETKNKKQTNTIHSLSRSIDKLKAEKSRMEIFNDSRNKDFEMERSELKHQILSLKDLNNKKMRQKGYQIPNNVIGVLNSVEKKHPNLVVTKEAKSESKKCKFEHPEQVLEILDIVAERHAKWIKSSKNGNLDLTKDKGAGGKKVDVTNYDSEPLIKEYNGKKYKVEKHIRIGTAHNEARCLRIYFETIDDELVIFYCGKHP